MTQNSFLKLVARKQEPQDEQQASQRKERHGESIVCTVKAQIWKCVKTFTRSELSPPGTRSQTGYGNRNQSTASRTLTIGGRSKKKSTKTLEIRGEIKFIYEQTQESLIPIPASRKTSASCGQEACLADNLLLLLLLLK